MPLWLNKCSEISVRLNGDSNAYLQANRILASLANVFYWVNLSCIIAAGLSSFLRITDVYSTSFFKRIGVIVTVNVITMIFCSFSLYFIDPNTFWNTTAKTKETKNTENNNSNANDNANANQQSSN